MRPNKDKFNQEEDFFADFGFSIFCAIAGVLFFLLNLNIAAILLEVFYYYLPFLK